MIMKPYFHLRYLTAYIRSVFRRLRLSRRGLIYFDKYDKSGAYHWEHYYKRKTPFYIKLVDTVVCHVPENSRVLDVGCGDGLIAHRISTTRKSHVTGIDMNPVALYHAREKHASYASTDSFVESSIYDFESDNLFDCAVVVEVFEHVELPDGLLSKLQQLIKHNGKLIITTPIAVSERKISKYHFTEYSEDEFVDFLTRHSFRVCNKEYLLNDKDSSCIIIAECIRV